MAALEREGKGDLRRVIVRISFLFHFERLPRRLQTRGGGVLPYKTLMGTCGSPGYVFRDFCLKQGIDFIIFCLNQGIDFINFCLKQGIFSWTINILRMFYELNYSKIFIYYFLTQGMVSG